VSIISEELQIPAKYHQSFIGAGGKLIQSIMEDCGGVQIKFPPSESGSDKVAGMPVNKKVLTCMPCHDYLVLAQVVIRGPKEEVEKAKKTLLDMSVERNLSGYTEIIRSKPEHHRYKTGNSRF